MKAFDDGAGFALWPQALSEADSICHASAAAATAATAASFAPSAGGAAATVRDNRIPKRS